MTASADDIITYIGVPLAVLGVLPILYNTIATLVAVSRIRRMLRHSDTTASALTRSDVVNRVIEVELPRYTIAPLSRSGPPSSDEPHLYWSLSSTPSGLPGGSWTTFNWRTRVVGFRTQRVEYVDQLRQPQSEVDLEQLVGYLLDLGAVPEPRGWRLLRSTGLWAPVGCALMTAPDGKERALTVAPSDDADGFLSLAVTWRNEWATRGRASLPPYWMRLPARVGVDEKKNDDSRGEVQSEAVVKEGEEVLVEVGMEPQSRNGRGGGSGSGHDQSQDKGQDEVQNGDNVQPCAEEAGNSNMHLYANCEISCHLTSTGLHAAIPESPPTRPSSYSSSSSSSSSSANPLPTTHLRPSPSRPDQATTNASVWFSSAATAFGTSSATVLWSYRIPDPIVAFARRETVPCGVLVLLNLVDENATPQWATKHDDLLANHDKFTRRMRQQRLDMDAESRLMPAQKAAAQQDRMRREAFGRIDEAREQLRTEKQRREQRALEALQSPRWSARTIAPHALRLLQSPATPVAERVPAYLPARDAAGQLLRRMVLDGDVARGVCHVLDMWRAWADNGGMRQPDLDVLVEDVVVFAWAVLLVALIGEAAGEGGQGGDGSLSADLQECMSLWKTVRLG